MKIELRFFTGTGNSRKVLNTCKDVFDEAGNQTHISKQLLEVHLNQDVDLASRKYSTIEKTVYWVLDQTSKENMQILDLGCGPGLYSELFAQKGHTVTGVDFSENSIRYVREQTEKKQLDIHYIHDNYLNLDLPENKFDLVFFIFTDFGPLLPNEREQLLSIVKKVLKTGGLFILDVLNNTNIVSKVSPQSWEASEKGFWKNTPYITLSESFLYEQEKVILYQHTVLDGTMSPTIYRFWTHFFSDDDLESLLSKYNFSNITFHRNILPDGLGYSADDVTLCVASQSE